MWDVNDLMDYWQDYPPTHVLVAAYLMGGNKSSSSKRRRDRTTGSASDNTSSNFNELAHEVSLAGGSVNKKLPEIYKRDKKFPERSDGVPLK